MKRPLIVFLFIISVLVIAGVAIREKSTTVPQRGDPQVTSSVLEDAMNMAPAPRPPAPVTPSPP